MMCPWLFENTLTQPGTVFADTLPGIVKPVQQQLGLKADFSFETV